MKRKNKHWKEFLSVLFGIVIVILLLYHFFPGYFGSKDPKAEYKEAGDAEWCRPELNVKLLSLNRYSRPGIALNDVKGIVIHYVGNPGTTAMENRNYFEGLKDSHATKASSHFIIGMDGEIVQCIPTKEIAYASNNRNKDTIAIKCCHPDESGKFTKETYESLIHLTGYLCYRFGLDENDLIRHYDVTGKMCPLYYVKHEDAWNEWKDDLAAYLKKLRIEVFHKNKY